MAKNKKTVLDLGPSAFFQQVVYPFLVASSALRGTSGFKTVIPYRKWDHRSREFYMSRLTVNIHVYWAKMQTWLSDRQYTTNGRKNGASPKSAPNKKSTSPQLALDI